MLTGRQSYTKSETRPKQLSLLRRSSPWIVCVQIAMGVFNVGVETASRACSRVLWSDLDGLTAFDGDHVPARTTRRIDGNATVYLLPTWA